MRQALASLALAALLAPPAAAQGSASLLERFQLFNACRPMELVIEQLVDDAADIGLTRETLQAAAESRLRAARLYTEDRKKAGYARLYVYVHMVRRVFSVSVEYEKPVTDEFGRSGFPPTWRSSSIGAYGGNAGYIVQSLSRHLDKFS